MKDTGNDNIFILEDDNSYHSGMVDSFTLKNISEDLFAIIKNESLNSPYSYIDDFQLEFSPAGFNTKIDVIYIGNYDIEKPVKVSFSGGAFGNGYNNFNKYYMSISKILKNKNLSVEEKFETLKRGEFI